MVDRQTVERSGLAAVVGRLARVAECSRNEQILDRVVVAAGALEADHMPDFGYPGTALGKQHGALGRLAVGREPRRAVRLVQRAMAGEPARVLDAAGEAPGAGH